MQRFIDLTCFEATLRRGFSHDAATDPTVAEVSTLV